MFRQVLYVTSFPKYFTDCVWQIQKQEGIDAVIVDLVLKVRKGLTAPMEYVTSMNGSTTSGNMTASMNPSEATSSAVSTASSDGDPGRHTVLGISA
jgi:hypothetical protein